MIRSTRDEHMKLSMTPTRRRPWTLSAPLFELNAWRRNIATRAPAKPARGIPYGPERRLKPRTLLSATPRAAPPETPSVYGSTRGFRKRPCKTTPERLKPPPTAMPSNTLGRRMSRMMLR